MKIVLTGGGTAGHVVPCLALIDTLAKHFSEIHYIGSKDGIEKTLTSEYKNIKYHEITCRKLERRKFWKNLILPFSLIKGRREALAILKEVKPNIIFSKGGFVSVPVILAGKKLKINMVCHESDISIGLANKIGIRYCKKVCTTFEITAKNLGEKAICTGSPIRQDIVMIKNSLKTSHALYPTVLIMGGSQGAKAINDAVTDEMFKHFNVIHLTGKGKKTELYHTNYTQIEYTSNISKLFKEADIVVARSGSNTLFELAYLAKPMLLIPLPKGNSRGDQVDNAKYFKELNFANVLTEKDLNPKSLIREIFNTLKNQDKYKKAMKAQNTENGTQKIVNVILSNTKR